ncbi:MAG: tRNA pseudouridine(55) synthase TruB, partial [Dehalococcoidia bacterium]|nr:tRNA pseudouridine(55) synthase TruB [Dehalococcoidia bacterium]
WEPPILTLEVECSPGTYIRSIAHDLGQVLGCGAHLKSLVRLRDGPFILEESVTLEEMEKRADEGGWDDLLRPLDAVMGGWTKVILESLLAEDVLHGRDVELDQVDGEMNESQGLCAAYSADGQLLAVLRRRPDSGVWHPYKVLV